MDQDFAFRFRSNKGANHSSSLCAIYFACHKTMNDFFSSKSLNYFMIVAPNQKTFHPKLFWTFTFRQTRLELCRKYLDGDNFFAVFCDKVELSFKNFLHVWRAWTKFIEQKQIVCRLTQSKSFYDSTDSCWIILNMFKT